MFNFVITFVFTVLAIVRTLVLHTQWELGCEGWPEGEGCSMVSKEGQTVSKEHGEKEGRHVERGAACSVVSYATSFWTISFDMDAFQIDFIAMTSRLQILMKQ